MTIVRQRQRIARVRKLQHGLAANAAAQANGQVRQLENSHERLGAMREVLRPAEGTTFGALLAAHGELAMRLDAARAGLVPTIVNARATAEQRDAVRLGARREFESAQKLQRKAAAAAAEADERRNAAAHRPRSRPSIGESR
jgi:hypothetical protein